MLTNTKSSLSQIIDTSIDSVTNISVQDPPTTTLNALTTSINNHVTTSQQITNKRKRVVEWSYGESLTTIEALLKVNEKEKKKKTKNNNKASKYINKKTVNTIFLTMLYSPSTFNSKFACLLYKLFLIFYILVDEKKRHYQTSTATIIQSL